MTKYNIDKMLAEWGGSIATSDPYPAAATSTVSDVEDLVGGGDTSPSNVVDISTNIPGPSDPKNIPGPDKKKISEAVGDPINTSSPAPKPVEAPSSQMDPSMSGQPIAPPEGMDPSMMDPSMMGMGMSGPQDTFEVGRIYELKKIYSRLVSMQSYLAGTTDINLIKLRNYVSNTMDLFRTLISNIALYKDKLDEIIVIFYKVVDNVYVILSKYYKDSDSKKMIKAIE